MNGELYFEEHPWLRACAVVSEHALWVSMLIGLFVYFTALFCELLAAHTKLQRPTAIQGRSRR